MEDTSSEDDGSTTSTVQGTHEQKDVDNEVQKTSNIGNIMEATTTTPTKQESSENTQKPSKPDVTSKPKTSAKKKNTRSRSRKKQGRSMKIIRLTHLLDIKLTLTWSHV